MLFSKIRYIIYIILTLLFITSAPLLVFYTAGYRYNFKKNKFQKIGVLILESEPKGDKVSLNEKILEQKTPARISNLLPGDYKVKIEKENFYPWEKNLTVRSGLVTFAKNITLFKKSIPIQILPEENINLIASQNDKDEIIYNNQIEGKETFWNFNLKTKEKKLLFEISKKSDFLQSVGSPTPHISCSWAPNNKKILIEIGEDHYIVNIGELNKKIHLEKYFGLNFEKVKWDLKNDFLLYGVAQDKFYKINLSIKKATPFFSSKEISFTDISDYLVKDDLLYFIDNSDKEISSLKTVSLNNSVAKNIASLPPSKHYIFSESKPPFIALLNEKNNSLYLINPSLPSSSLQEVIFGVEDMEWAQNEKKLLYTNEFEIWIYDYTDTQESKKILLARFSKHIKKALWYPDNRHIIFLIGNSIKLMETDKKDRNTLELVSFEKIDEILNNITKNKLYFTGKIGSREGLYELEI